MRPNAALLLPLVLSLIAGCGEEKVSSISDEQTAQGTSPETTPDVAEEPGDAPAPDEESPRFWRGTEAAVAIEAIGYDDAYVYRWQNGAVEATGIFNSEDQEHWEFDSTKIPTTGGALDAPRSSGVFVVALTQQTSDVYNCRIGVTTGFGAKMERGILTHARATTQRWEGEVHVPPASGSGLRALLEGGHVDVKDNSAYVATGDGENRIEFVKIRFSASPDAP